MDVREHILTLQHNREVFASLLAPVPDDEAHWRPEENKWCLLEIVCHLIDEEREDFRARVDHVLHRPGQAMPGIDPSAWVSERKYMERAFGEMREAFLKERDASVKWLCELINPVWDNAYQHPKLGSMTARLFLNNWVAHDMLHVRQIIRTRYKYLEKSGGTSLSYAGDW
ncbi:MAG: DinB family protein [Flavobacteriales bacterium]|nr:DinB family protein [Flavobacteriales bacterium]